MQFIDRSRLDSIEADSFRARKPYPWTNPAGLLRSDAYEQLRCDLPPVSAFNVRFGKKRRHGQRPHDRYVLEYQDDLDIADSWHEFVAELRAPAYQDWVADMLGARRFFLTFHWHYTPNGCSVSPHCDAPRKLGSHIFYFNNEDDWRPEWGGQTVILDDGGRFSSRRAPVFEDFDREYEASALGNQSLFFGRNGNSWHGVREIRCPEDRLRKVFIVVVNRISPAALLKRATLALRAAS
ncbi:MAG: hypothetical protein EA417_15280 [Gammaproteobacteria bacterium]|nr:MAG: hypothetical protein EA417_15280 [Gammaproteobacteria bacterium]